MTPEETAFLRDLFRAVEFRPLDPGDPRYVSLYDRPDLGAEDPVSLLARSIEWTVGQSVQLFSGGRGTGKSTELRRLKRRLEDSGFLVALFDIEDYLNVAVPIDVSDFLITIAGAFDEACEREGWVFPSARGEPFWDRLRDFLRRTNFELGEFEVKAEGGVVGASVKANLKTDPTFRRQVQQHMAGHLGAFVDAVHGFIKELVTLITHSAPQLAGVVLLVDSMDHIRGTSTNVKDVQSSVENLFAQQAERLRLPNAHVVYTVPPYLKVRYPGLSSLYGAGGVQQLRAVKVHDRDTGDAFKPGFTALEEVVAGRGDWDRLLGDRALLDVVIANSGGHLRDLLRMLQEVIRRADRLPVDAAVVDRAVVQVQSEMLPIPLDDAVWLHEVATTKASSLPSIDRLDRLSTFLDTHLILVYGNGDEWYDVHPLVRDEVGRLAARAPTP